MKKSIVKGAARLTIDHLLLTVSGERGIAIIVATIIMVLLLSITGAALLFSGLNLKSAANLKAGSGALHVADAGIQHALAIIPAGLEFDALLAGSVSGFPLVSSKPTLTGSLSGYTYTVVAENDPSDSGGATDDTNKIVMLTSTATDPNGSKRKIKAYIGRSSVFVPPGAIYIPGAPQNIRTGFTGSAFRVSGNDTLIGGAVGSGSASPVPGIATTDSGTTNEITGPSGSLSSSQYGQVTGQGSSPSVTTTTSTLNVQTVADNIINQGSEGVNMQTLSAGNYTSGEWGTSTLPKITRITGGGITTLAGTLTGYGVIIVEGNVKIQGDFNFKGLLITQGKIDVKGDNDPGTATLWGALLVKDGGAPETADANFKVGGAAKLYYSSQALSVVTSNWGSTLPKAAKVIAWHEMMQ